jgi:hypothetical protein
MSTTAHDCQDALLEFAYEMKALVDAGDIEIPQGHAEAIAAHRRACEASAALTHDISQRIALLTATRRTEP